MTTFRQTKVSTWSLKASETLSWDHEDSSSSCNDDDPVEAPFPMILNDSTAAPRKTKLADFAGFEDHANDSGNDYMDNSLATKMQAVLDMQVYMRMNQDEEFMAEQERKRLERLRVAQMTPEQRLKAQEQQADNLLKSVKERFDLETIQRQRHQRKHPHEMGQGAVCPTSLQSSLHECEMTASESGDSDDDKQKEATNKQIKQRKKHRKAKRNDKGGPSHGKDDGKTKKDKRKKKNKERGEKKKKRGEKKRTRPSLVNNGTSLHQPRRIEAI